MSMLAKHLAFVEGQAQYHERMADDLSRSTKDSVALGKSRKHRASAGRFRVLASDLAAVDRRLQEAEIALKPVRLLRSINLMPDELEGLPEGLMSELVSESDRTERDIFKVIEECGGIASLDRIILSLYKKTGETHKRAATTSRLYRMSQKGVAFPVPGKKGVYSIKQLSEAEAAKLFAEQPTSSAT